MGLILKTASMTKSKRVDMSITQGKTKYYCPKNNKIKINSKKKKKNSNKMTLLNIVLYS